jgi:propionyl-CoA synthetase
MKVVDGNLGAVARPARVRFVSPAAQDPFRQAAAPRHPGGVRGRDPGDLTTMDDPTALQQIKELVHRAASRHFAGWRAVARPR